MASSSKPELIRFLNKHNILWMPIADMKLDAKGKKLNSIKSYLDTFLLSLISKTLMLLKLKRDRKNTPNLKQLQLILIRLLSLIAIVRRFPMK